MSEEGKNFEDMSDLAETDESDVKPEESYENLEQINEQIDEQTDEYQEELEVKYDEIDEDKEPINEKTELSETSIEDKHEQEMAEEEEPKEEAGIESPVSQEPVQEERLLEEKANIERSQEEFLMEEDDLDQYIEQLFDEGGGEVSEDEPRLSAVRHPIGRKDLKIKVKETDENGTEVVVVKKVPVLKENVLIERKIIRQPTKILKVNEFGEEVEAIEDYEVEIDVSVFVRTVAVKIVRNGIEVEKTIELCEEVPMVREALPRMDHTFRKKKKLRQGEEDIEDESEREIDDDFVSRISHLSAYDFGRGSPMKLSSHDKELEEEETSGEEVVVEDDDEEDDMDYIEEEEETEEGTVKERAKDDYIRLEQEDRKAILAMILRMTVEKRELQTKNVLLGGVIREHLDYLEDIDPEEGKKSNVEKIDESPELETEYNKKLLEFGELLKFMTKAREKVLNEYSATFKSYKETLDHVQGQLKTLEEKERAMAQKIGFRANCYLKSNEEIKFDKNERKNGGQCTSISSCKRKDRSC